MALLTLRGIRKAFGGRELFSGADLNVLEGERIGLVGPNGAGKTTLLRILAGVEEPDAGERTQKKGLKIAYLTQEPELAADARVRDAVRPASLEESEQYRVDAMISRRRTPGCRCIVRRTLRGRAAAGRAGAGAPGRTGSPAAR